MDFVEDLGVDLNAATDQINVVLIEFDADRVTSMRRCRGQCTARARRLDQGRLPVINLGWGFALLHRDFPLSYHHSRIVVTSAAPAAEILSMADTVLGGMGLHRYISVDDDWHGQQLTLASWQSATGTDRS